MEPFSLTTCLCVGLLAAGKIQQLLFNLCLMLFV